MPKRSPSGAQDLVKVLGPTLVLLRRVRRVTQQEISLRTGLDRSNLSRIESGNRVPCVPTLLLYIRATGTNLAQLGSLLEHLQYLGEVPAPPTPRQVGQILRRLRRRAQMDSDQLAEAAGVGASTIWSLEMALDKVSTERLLRVLMGLDSSLEDVQVLAQLEAAVKG